MINILKKPTLKRSDKDLLLLVPYMSQISFFNERDIKNDDMIDIVSCIQYERYEAGYIIF
jgi:hypothetical protein